MIGAQTEPLLEPVNLRLWLRKCVATASNFTNSCKVSVGLEKVLMLEKTLPPEMQKRMTYK